MTAKKDEVDATSQLGHISYDSEWSLPANSSMTAGSSKTLQPHHNRPRDFVHRTRDAGKFHTFACSGRYSPKLATYELHELDEYRRARQQQDTSVTDEELIEQMKDYEREDLLRLVLEQHTQLLTKNAYVHDLEDYIDNLLVKVMETHPKILQNPYVWPTNNCNNSSAVNSLPASASLPPGVYVANQLNKSSSESDTTPSLNSKVKSKKGKASRIELLHIFPQTS